MKQQGNASTNSCVLRISSTRPMKYGERDTINKQGVLLARIFF